VLNQRASFIDPSLSLPSSTTAQANSASSPVSPQPWIVIDGPPGLHKRKAALGHVGGGHERVTGLTPRRGQRFSLEDDTCGREGYHLEESDARSI